MAPSDREQQPLAMTLKNIGVPRPPSYPPPSSELPEPPGGPPPYSVDSTRPSSILPAADIERGPSIGSGGSGARFMFSADAVWVGKVALGTEGFEHRSQEHEEYHKKALREEMLREAIGGELLRTVDPNAPRVALCFQPTEVQYEQSIGRLRQKTNDLQHAQTMCRIGLTSHRQDQARLAYKDQQQLVAETMAARPLMVLSEFKEGSMDLGRLADHEAPPPGADLQGLPGLTRAVVFASLFQDRPDDIKLPNMIWDPALNERKGGVQRIDTAFLRGNELGDCEFHPDQLGPQGRHDLCRRDGIMTLLCEANHYREDFRPYEPKQAAVSQMHRERDQDFLEQHLGTDKQVQEEAMGALKAVSALKYTDVLSIVERMTKVPTEDSPTGEEVDLADDNFRQQCVNEIIWAKEKASGLLAQQQRYQERLNSPLPDRPQSEGRSRRSKSRGKAVDVDHIPSGSSTAAIAANREKRKELRTNSAASEGLAHQRAALMERAGDIPGDLHIHKDGLIEFTVPGVRGVSKRAGSAGAIQRQVRQQDLQWRVGVDYDPRHFSMGSRPDKECVGVYINPREGKPDFEAAGKMAEILREEFCSPENQKFKDLVRGRGSVRSGSAVHPQKSTPLAPGRIEGGWCRGD